MRGNRIRVSESRAYLGSIPACAGEPSVSSFVVRVSRVYPRVCGGTGVRQRPTTYRAGLSPRVRGNHVFRVFCHSLIGSIPRVRGNPYTAGNVSVTFWSIPACAGEPSQIAHRRQKNRVYPRVCGGTATSVGAPVMGSGYWVYPRVCGGTIRVAPVMGSTGKGSIPACAGEP